MWCFPPAATAPEAWRTAKIRGLVQGPNTELLKHFLHGGVSLIIQDVPLSVTPEFILRGDTGEALDNLKMGLVTR